MLAEHLQQMSGECVKFGYLPDMRSNYPYHLGFLALESFSKRIISAVNLLVDAHRALLDHDNIDNMVVLKKEQKDHGKSMAQRGFHIHCVSRCSFK